jgi:hypothetical protein
MKLHHIAIAALAALSTQAFALNAADTAAAPVKLYITGSSALQPVIEGLLNQPGNCVVGTYTKYAGLAGSPAGSGDTKNGNSQNAYSCTIAAGSDFGSTFNGQNVTIIKREAGGSAQGVFPLYSTGTPTATVALIDLTSCNDTDQTCNNVASVVPDAGVSDLEPVAFNSVVNQPSAFAGQVVANTGFRSVTSVAEQVFALIGNDNLNNDLIALTGSASIPKAAFASIFASGYDSLTLGWLPFGRNSSGSPATFLPGATNQVNLCSRAIGSGTRATAQIQFLDLPYNVFAASVAIPSGNTVGAVRGGNTAGAFFVSEESSSGNVVGCVAAANVSGGYSVGIVGADRDLTGTGTHFLSIDNVAPGRAAGKEGQYQWMYESFYNVSKKVASTSTTLFPNAFGAAFKLAKNINAISATAANGVMANPANCSGSTAAAWVTDELAACARVSRGKDSRRPLTFAK